MKFIGTGYWWTDGTPYDFRNWATPGENFTFLVRFNECWIGWIRNIL